MRIILVHIRALVVVSLCTQAHFAEAADSHNAALQYKKACDGGAAEGCFSLGLCYNNGYGVTKNSARAALFYQKACDGGEKNGCDALAKIKGGN